jgi:hypothetical protein
VQLFATIFFYFVGKFGTALWNEPDHVSFRLVFFCWGGGGLIVSSCLSLQVGGDTSRNGGGLNGGQSHDPSTVLRCSLPLFYFYLYLRIKATQQHAANGGEPPMRARQPAGQAETVSPACQLLQLSLLLVRLTPAAHASDTVLLSSPD